MAVPKTKNLTTNNPAHFPVSVKNSRISLKKIKTKRKYFKKIAISLYLWYICADT